MRFRATLTSKGQLTLPAKMRDRLNLKTGDDVVFVEREDGAFVLDAKRPDFLSLRGIVRLPAPAIDDWVEEARSARGRAASPAALNRRAAKT